MRRAAAVILGLILPGAAEACSVCGANGPGQSNFLGPTIFLSLLPLGLVFGGLMWLRRRMRAAEAAEAAEQLHEPIRTSAGSPLAGRPEATPGTSSSQPA